MAGVEPGYSGKDSLKQPVHKIDFTYSGDIFNIPVGDNENDYINYWPVEDSDGINTQLPWAKQYSYYDDIMISSTPMVWYWQQYTEYDPTNPRQYPGIYTRYYDGSP